MLSNNTHLSDVPITYTLFSLKKLVIRECPKITFLGSLEKLELLHDLSITGCKKLSEVLAFPPNLERLKIKGCSYFNCMRGVSLLAKLKVLIVEGNIENLTAFKAPYVLEELHITRNSACAQLNLEQFKNLKILRVRKCDQLELITGAESLLHLRTVYINDCKKLKNKAVSLLKQLKNTNKEGFKLIIDGKPVNSSNFCSIQ